MTTELLVWIEDDATEEHIKDIAAVLSTNPFVIGVYRHVPIENLKTHEAPGDVQ